MILFIFGGTVVSFSCFQFFFLPFLFLFYVQHFKYGLYLKILNYQGSNCGFFGMMLILYNEMYKVLSV